MSTVSSVEPGEHGLAAFLCATHLRWLAEQPEQRWRELECSLLFADVSGFTRLGERLAARGRIGAEQLTDAVNAIFESMLEQVERGGGELVKFGGDAILVLFEGREHERRACASAQGIQDALARLRVLPGEAAGTMSVSAGVASGLGHLFLSGDSPRELILAGPLASTVVRLEGLAEAGEVIVSSRTAAAVGEEHLGAARADARLLAAGPLPLDSSPPPVPDAVDPRAGLPAHLHDHEPGYGEHRAVSIGFLQFRGSDRLLADEGAAVLADALDGILTATARACHDWGVTLVSSDVDRDAGKLLLCAGAPTASDNDADRILHALRAVVARDWPLRVRAGVNRGQAFTVDIGPPRRRVWSLIGDSVNLAARVMGHAGDGQLLATESALGPLHDEFERAPVEPFAVKGKSAPVKAELIGDARAARRTPTPHREAPFVGRREELATLREAIAFAAAGGRRIVELVGEPGIGKSRLLEAIIDEGADLPVIRIQAGPYGVHSPYLALRGPLRALIGCAPDATEDDVEARLSALIDAQVPELRDWLPLVAIPLGLDLIPTLEIRSLAPEFARQRLNAAFAHFLEMVLPETPIVVVVEDAHWLDEASADLLIHLFTADRATGPRHDWGASTEQAAEQIRAGLAAIVTRRAIAQGMALGEVPGVVRLELEPLSFEDAGLLILGDAEESIPLETRTELLARADGNPLLLGELVAAVRTGKSLNELPDSVEGLMTARIDTLPRRQRLLIREASVLGARVDIELLADLVGVERDELEMTLAGLDDFLRPEGADAMRFRHELLRASAYGALSYRRRHELHSRAGETIEAKAANDVEAQSELLAIHFHAAARWDRSWHYARLAGERAGRRAAPHEAAEFFAGALEAARHLRSLKPIEVAATNEALGDAAELAGEYERAASAFGRARKLRKGDGLGLARLCLRQGQVAESSRHLSGALRWFTRGLNELNGSPRGPDADALRAKLVLAQGATRLRAGRLRECLPHLAEAVTLAEQSGERSTLAHAYYLLDWAHTDLGLPGGERYRDLALPIFEELEDYARQGRVLNNLGVDAYYECHWEEAVEFYERSRVASEKAGDAVDGRSAALNNIAEIRLDQGRIDEAEELLREALASWRGARHRAGIGTALKNLARIATRRDNLGRAAELLAQARAEFEAIGSDAMLAEADTWEAERLLAAGQIEGASRLLERISRAADRVDITPAIRADIDRLAAQAASRSGDNAAAIELLQRSVAIAREASSDYQEALGTLDLAKLSETGGGERLDPGDLAAAEQRARATLVRLGVVGDLA